MSLDLTGIADVFAGWIEGSRIVVIRESAAAPTLGADGHLVPAAPTLVYDGPGIVQAEQNEVQGPTDPDVATMPVDSTTPYVALMPLGANPDIFVGDCLVVVATPPISADPAAVGRWYEVTAPPKTSSIAVLRPTRLKPTRRPKIPDGWAPPVVS